MAFAERSILNFPEYRDSLPPEQRATFDNIFLLRRISVPLVFVSEQAKFDLAKKFRLEYPDLIDQREVLRVTNRVWGEGTQFNPLRAHRPLQSGSTKQADEAMQKLEVVNLQGDNCDFCTYPTQTPGDPFGDIRGENCVTRANVAGYDGLHSLILDPGVHHPLKLTREVISDMVHTGVNWVLAANKYAREQMGISDAEYPFFVMNNLPRAGASVFHPHMQALLAIGEPYDLAKNLRDRMSDYQWLNGGRSYFNDLIDCLKPLGLVERVEEASVIFNPAPIKEAEVVIVADDLEGLPNGSLSAGIAEVIEWWKSIGITSFDMAIFMPKLGESLRGGSWHQLKPFARMVGRGPEGNNVSDFGTMEIYGSSVVATDPFKLASSFRESHFVSAGSSILLDRTGFF